MKLSVFDDRQLVMEVPGTMFGGLRQTQELDGNARDDDLYWFGPSESSKSFYVQLA
jgi:hypothetical protein